VNFPEALQLQFIEGDNIWSRKLLTQAMPEKAALSDLTQNNGIARRRKGGRGSCPAAPRSERATGL